MYKCNDCKSVFEEPQEISEIHFEVSEPDREWFSVCPSCLSGGFEEVTLCPICQDNYIKSSEDYCDSCTEIVLQGFNRALDGLKTELGTDVPLSLIERWIEGL